MKSLLATVFATLLCVSFANADVDSSLRRLENVIKNNVPANNRPQLLEAFDKLVADLNKLECVDESTNQNNLPQCQLKGAGNYNYEYFNFTIVNSSNIVISAANSSDGLINKAKELKDKSICTVKRETCEIAGAGTLTYEYFNFTVKTSTGLIVGASHSGTDIYDVMNKLKQAKICQ